MAVVDSVRGHPLGDLHTFAGFDRIGTAGRNALLEIEVGADAQARDVAKLILGLPAQALAEFAA